MSSLNEANTGVLDQVKACIATVLQRSAEPAWSDSTSLSGDLHLDSSMFIELLMDIEDHVPGVVFDPETMRKEDFETIGSLARYVATVKSA